MQTSDTAVCDDPLAAFYTDALALLEASAFRSSSAGVSPSRATRTSTGTPRTWMSSSARPISRARSSSSTLKATRRNSPFRTGSPR